MGGITCGGSSSHVIVVCRACGGALRDEDARCEREDRFSRNFVMHRPIFLDKNNVHDWSKFYQTVETCDMRHPRTVASSTFCTDSRAFLPTLKWRRSRSLSLSPYGARPSGKFTCIRHASREFDFVEGISLLISQGKS